MEAKTKSRVLSIAQAKKTSADGTITYYYSLPKVSIFNITGMFWLYRRLKEFKKNREPNSIIIYN